jgi:hypothetical protein
MNQNNKSWSMTHLIELGVRYELGNALIRLSEHFRRPLTDIAHQLDRLGYYNHIANKSNRVTAILKEELVAELKINEMVSRSQLAIDEDTSETDCRDYELQNEQEFMEENEELRKIEELEQFAIDMHHHLTQVIDTIIAKETT